MKLQDFIDLGFAITFNQLTTNYVRVAQEDKRYIEIFEKCKDERNVNTYQLQKEYKVDINGRTYQGTVNGMELISLTVSEYKEGNRIIIEKDDVELMLYVDKDTNVVDRVLDCLWYFGSSSSHQDIYGRLHNDDNISVNDVLKDVYRMRMKNSQNIRNHYNKELKKIKEEYRHDLDKSKKGMNFLKRFEVK